MVLTAEEKAKVYNLIRSQMTDESITQDWFDLLDETKVRTTLATLRVQENENIRAARDRLNAELRRRGVE